MVKSEIPSCAQSTFMDKQTRHRILTEQNNFTNTFRPDKDAIPDHVMIFVEGIIQQVKQFGYAVWHDNLYEPPTFVVEHTSREKDYFAFEYARIKSGLKVVRLNKIPFERIRAIHQSPYRPTLNVYILNPTPPSIEKLKDYWPK
jgi:hypothetical protein